jgi:hypothetical protein
LTLFASFIRFYADSCCRCSCDTRSHFKDTKRSFTATSAKTKPLGAVADVEQRRFFEIQNFGSSTWEELGDNATAQDWIWFQQEFILQASDLSSYFNTNGLIQIRYHSTNEADASNLNYLQVQVTKSSEPSPS